MSDHKTRGSGSKGKLSQMTENPFFNFSKPYLEFISRGKVFSLVYIVMAMHPRPKVLSQKNGSGTFISYSCHSSPFALIR
jgi:hypothetical protein